MADLKDNQIIMIILAIFLPPVAVALKVGATGHLWINLLLWILTWVGGIIHGLYVVLSK
jgi:uncharacterized membrane protein YqaE (UPF0057 family)